MRVSKNALNASTTISHLYIDTSKAWYDIDFSSTHNDNKFTFTIYNT